MEGKYYWLKIKKDFFKRHDIKIIESMENGKEISLFYLKLMLESVDHDGELRFSEMVPYTPEMLATITSTKLEIVNESLHVLLNLGMIRKTDNETLVIEQVKSMIGCASNTDEARRQRLYRERKKKERNENVTSVTVNVTNSNESKSKSKSKNKSKNNIYIVADEIINYLNGKTGRQFKASETTKRLINARISEGYTADDFKTVIDKKCGDWKGTDYEKYLQPSTLFAPSHFDNYLNQPVKKGKEDMFASWLKGD